MKPTPTIHAFGVSRECSRTVAAQWLRNLRRNGTRFTRARVRSAVSILMHLEDGGEHHFITYKQPITH